MSAKDAAALKRVRNMLEQQREFAETLRHQQYSDDLAQLLEDTVSDIEYAIEGGEAS